MSGIDGRMLGEFKILTKIGQGGMGTVYLAEQPALNRRVAVKVLLASLASDADFPKRFKREAMLAASINHPGLVQVYAAGDIEDIYYIAMEYVDGESLQRRLEREGRIKPDEALDIILRLAQALDYAWQKVRLIHRDVKPSNVLLSTDGDVKLADFGMAKNAELDSTLTSTGMHIGTPLYISPEQARCHKVLDFSTDMYSLGCTLYHMLCGRTPYSGEAAFTVMLQHVTEPAPAIRTHMPECPPAIVKLLDRMLAKDPASRHASYAELIEELRHAREIIGKPPKRLRRAHLVAAVVTVVLAVLGWWRVVNLKAPPASPTVLAVAGSATPAPQKPAAPAKDAAFLTEVAALPAEAQARRVLEKLKELNPDFEPESATYVVRDGSVVELVLSITAISDLAPVRALASLERLRLGQPGQTGAIESLEPLRGLPLIWLECHNSPIGDLSPLRGMPLTWLVCPGAHIADLTPLKDSPIEALGINNTGVTNLAPLAGLPLKFLNCGYNPISDLSPLAGMPLTDLNCSHSEVRDITPLKGMALTRLICSHASIEDLSPVGEMPLKDLDCDFRRDRDEKILRAIPTLEKINGLSAEDFWRSL